MSNVDQAKRDAAEAAYAYVREGEYLGVGTGSTVNHFIDVLADARPRIKGCVASSKATDNRLRAAGLEVEQLNSAGELSVYIDGADEANRHLELIKGGGGALTREKVLAATSRNFVCIVDDSKLVDLLGGFPLPVEVLEMARSGVARELVKLGGDPELRDGFTTDDGNVILDVRNLRIDNPIALEDAINALPGVVAVGLFARHRADALLVAGKDGVRTLTR